MSRADTEDPAGATSVTLIAPQWRVVAKSRTMMVRRTHTDTRERHVTDLILAGELAPDAVETVVDAGLAAYALARAGSRAAELDTRLHASRLAAVARHAAIRRATADLVRAWGEVGIDALLFKGFYLAEFVYPEPSWRAYSDVDIALRGRSGVSLSDVARLAAEVAASRGFQVVWRYGEEEELTSHHDHAYDGHELLQLVHVATGVSVDAHRRLVHSNVSLARQSEKGEVLTRRVWEGATVGRLDGAEVYLPAPVDSALVGLIAARSWSGDRYSLRPHDLLDLDMLMRHGAFGKPELLARAADLGIVATTKLFLRRCDPAAGKVELREPSAARAFLFDALLVTERGHRGLAQLSASLTAAPGRAWAVLREVPAVAGAVARWRAGGLAPMMVPSPWEPGVTPPESSVRDLDRRTWRATQMGVRRALKLLGVSANEQPDLALACAYASLLRRGFGVTWHEEAGGAWLEHEGARLPVDQLFRGSETARD